MKNLFQFCFVALTALTITLTGCKEDPPPVDTNAETLAAATAAATAAFDDGGNTAENPSFASNSIAPTNINWGSLSAACPTCTPASFKGAVDPSNLWYAGWSFYENILNGLPSDVYPTRPEVTISAGCVGTTTWTNTNTYILDGRVAVCDGEVLTIEAGTIIKGKNGDGEMASALIVAQGGQIFANGTAADPIIMTAVGDNGGNAADVRGLWGGLLILGKASTNNSATLNSIEGFPSDYVQGKYGGNDNADNSGSLTYVSIRHGGKDIGEGNEINGLTLGAVGSGTTIDYVEVIGNTDDGIEWFGGTVNAKHLISAFCGDDALDYDQGYRGQNQFVIVHQDPAADAADRGGEHDGGPSDNESGTPYATPVFYNVTSVGNSGSRALTFRDNAGGEYHNSIFTGFNKGIDVELLYDSSQDSYKQFVDGNLKIENNWFHNIGAGSTGAELMTISDN